MILTAEQIDCLSKEFPIIDDLPIRVKIELQELSNCIQAMSNSYSKPKLVLIDAYGELVD